MKLYTAFFVFVLFISAGKIFAQEQSIIRLNTSIQGYNPGQPWDKLEPANRRGLATYIGEGKCITSSELVANASFLEFETVDGVRRIPAKVSVVDYEVNLALVEALDKEGKKFLEDNLEAVELADFATKGEKVTILQYERSGVALKTEGTLRGAKVLSGFVNGNHFLYYLIKASMQSAASSFSLPVFKEGKLLCVVVSYNSDEQIVDAISPGVIKTFIDNARSGSYTGIPKLGISTAKTTDPHFRKWLKLEENQGGVYVRLVKNLSSAADAGIKKGDVILSINDVSIDSIGYYESKNYGKLHWVHLLHTQNKVGESVQFKILRDGKEQIVKVKLKGTQESVIPSHSYDKAPHYLVKGGIIFQEMSKNYLGLFGENWRSRAPLSLIDVYDNPEKYEKDRNRVVFISGVIPTPATLGYENIRAMLITKVNGKQIKDIKSLAEAFKKPVDGLHKIELKEEPRVIYLSSETSDSVDTSLLQRGLPYLSRY